MKRLWLVLALTAVATGYSTPNRIFSSYYVENLNAPTMRVLGEQFDIARRKGPGFEVFVPQDSAPLLLRLVPNAKLVEKDVSDVLRRRDKEHPGWRGSYRDFDSVQTELKTIVTSHPDMGALENYGSSEDGRPLVALRLTGKAAFADKPELMITSSTHGDEITTVEVLMDFVEGLIKNYGTDARITAMLDKHVIYFIPVVCPDGYVNQTRECNGLDPNRDYPYPADPDHVSNASIRNETTWFATHHIVGSVDIHSNLATVMYPWAYTDSPPDASDVTRFKQIGTVMAQDTGYNFGQIAEVFGIAKGSSADYWYWKGKTLAFGYEIGDDFIVESERVHSLVHGNQEALWHFIEFF